MIDKNTPKSNVAIGGLIMHALLYGLLYLIMCVLAFYVALIAVMIMCQHMDREPELMRKRQQRLMLRSRYIEARNQREQIEVALTREPWLESKLRKSLIAEMDALEKYLIHRGKRSHRLEYEGRLLAIQIDAIAAR